MEPLKISKYYTLKGLYIYCNRCKRLITKKNGQLIKNKICNHSENQVYKSVIYPAGKKTAKTKVHVTRDIKEACKYHLDFESEVKLGVKKVELEGKPEKPWSIKGAIGLYFTYLIQTSGSQKKTQHQKQVERYILNFGKFLKNEGLNLDTQSIDEIEPKHIKLFRNYLEKKYSSITFNRYLTLLKSFFNHLINIEGYQIKNPFQLEKHKPVCQITKSFPISKLIAFLDTICPENGTVTYANGVKKYLYTSYLKNLILLAAYSGTRRDGIVKMKFSDITSDDLERPLFIKTEDYKFNRRHHLTFENEKKIIILPVPIELENLLYSLGYKENVHSNRLIIENLTDDSENVIKNKLSKAFSHYWNLFSQDKGIKLKSLRKSYVSEMHIRYGSIATLVTHGATGDVVNRNYMDVMRIVNDLRGKKLYNFDQNPTP